MASTLTPAMFPQSRRAGFFGPSRIVGTFGGSDALLPGILEEPVDYLSIGPVFATTTKQTSSSADRS